MKINTLFLVLVSLFPFFSGCQPDSFDEPVIPMDRFTVAEGFEIQLTASEPFVESPVAMDFDNQGRIWTIEMPGYMPNLLGTEEEKPTGRISILEDLDKDGITDHSTVFIDSLILPRAIALVYGGALYVDPPNLWFVEINNDKPGKKTLVDSLYADGGNVEMKPNGLLVNIDNWIYNARSNARYQLKNGKWKREAALFRGQWGITKDNVGRLYYNNNTVQLIGDYVLPNTFIRNPYLHPSAAINKILTDNQRVYPLHPTTVNRGGEKGTLNKDSLLIDFTAACAPMVYRGDQFPDEYSENIFACEPTANLVKRNILTFEGITTTARQVWNDKEFLASTDEGFRPVNIFNGPDGSMYVADMHHGIMQHKAYMTPYYANRIAGKKLDTIIGLGRIFRVKNKNKPLDRIPDLNSATVGKLVELLKSKNGWLRDRAQQLIIFKQDRSAVAALELLVKNSDEITVIHALHTLNGLDALSFDLLREAARTGKGMVTPHALLLLEQWTTAEHAEAMQQLTADLLIRRDQSVDLYLALALGPWTRLSPAKFLPVLETVSGRYAGEASYQEAVISSLEGLEEKFRELITDSTGRSGELLVSLLDQTLKNRKADNKNSIYVQQLVPTDERTAGLTIFRSTCATCHGIDGNGIENLAPPLKTSPYISGSPDKLAMIILHGLNGPVEIEGKSYSFNGSMPAFASNFTDKQIADVIVFLHNAYVSGGQDLNESRIGQLRTKRTEPLTEKILKGMPDIIK